MNNEINITAAAGYSGHTPPGSARTQKNNNLLNELTHKIRLMGTAAAPVKPSADIEKFMRRSSAETAPEIAAKPVFNQKTLTEPYAVVRLGRKHSSNDSAPDSPDPSSHPYDTPRETNTSAAYINHPVTEQADLYARCTRNYREKIAPLTLNNNNYARVFRKPETGDSRRENIYEASKPLFNYDHLYGYRPQKDSNLNSSQLSITNSPDARTGHVSSEKYPEPEQRRPGSHSHGDDTNTNPRTEYVNTIIPADARRTQSDSYRQGVHAGANLTSDNSGLSAAGLNAAYDRSQRRKQTMYIDDPEITFDAAVAPHRLRAYAMTERKFEKRPVSQPVNTLKNVSIAEQGKVIPPAARQMSVKASAAKKNQHGITKDKALNAGLNSIQVEGIILDSFVLGEVVSVAEVIIFIKSGTNAITLNDAKVQKLVNIIASVHYYRSDCEEVLILLTNHKKTIEANLKLFIKKLCSADNCPVLLALLQIKCVKDHRKLNEKDLMDMAIEHESVNIVQRLINCLNLKLPYTPSALTSGFSYLLEKACEEDKPEDYFLMNTNHDFSVIDLNRVGATDVCPVITAFDRNCLRTVRFLCKHLLRENIFKLDRFQAGPIHRIILKLTQMSRDEDNCRKIMKIKDREAEAETARTELKTEEQTVNNMSFIILSHDPKMEFYKKSNAVGISPASIASKNHLVDKMKKLYKEAIKTAVSQQ